MDGSSREPVALVGVGEMGGVFASALLKAGHPVHPILRSTSMAGVADLLPDPALALVTVGEADLHAVMDGLPAPWRDRTGLIQNELLPRDWLEAGLSNPTVAVVWFEKKPGRDVKVIIPTPVSGPAAGMVAEALGAIGIPTVTVDDDEKLEYELVRKNLYILTANITGLITGGTVAALWDDHRDIAEPVAHEVLAIQASLVGHVLDPDGLIAGMIEAFAADPEHGATGRSAPGRLARALDHAAAAGINVPTLESIARRQSSGN